MFETHLQTLIYVFLSCYPGVTCNYWGFAGIYVNGYTNSSDDVSMVIENESLVTCIFQCTYRPECLIVSYQSNNMACIGYNRSNMIGPFKPEDPDVKSPNDYISLYFNYDYANSVGFVSNLQSGTSYRISDIRLTHAEAETECQKWNAYLITFIYQSQITELMTVISENHLLENETGVFVSGQGYGNSFHYPNGKQVPDSFWVPMLPSRGFGNQCVALTKFGLKVHICTDSLYVICSLL